MAKYEVDDTLTAWEAIGNEVFSIDLKDPYETWEASLSPHERASRIGLATGISQFLGANILARPDLLKDDESVVLASYSSFVLKHGSDISRPDFEVADSVTQRVRLSREGVRLRGAFIDNAAAETSMGFSLCAIRSVLKPSGQGEWHQERNFGQEGFGVGIREGYFMTARLCFDDGEERPNWTFGPVYALPTFPDSPDSTALYPPQKPYM